MCSPQVCIGSVKLYSSLQLCTQKYSLSYKLCPVVQYICTWIYIYKVLCPFVHVSHLCDFSWNDAMKIEYDFGSHNYFITNKLELKNLRGQKNTHGPFGVLWNSYVCSITAQSLKKLSTRVSWNELSSSALAVQNPGG